MVDPHWQQPTVREPVPDVSEVDRDLVRSVAWTGGAKWASQLFAWASTLIVARLLTPEDYGLVGMASVYLGLVTLVSEFGLGTAVITLRALSREQIAQLNGLAVLFGAGGLVMSCGVAIPLSRFFHASELTAVVVVMSSTFVITAFKTIPGALLQRDMQFRPLALIETGRAALLAMSMVAFALLGWRYWTLVIGAVTSAAFATGATIAFRRHAIAWPRRRALAEAVTFSRRLLAARLSWYAYSNADFLVAGRVLGQAALGAYSFAWTLANLPIEKITSLVSQVTPSVFSAVQHDHAAIRRYLLGITEGLSLITFPAALGLALVAPDVVPLVLGDHWQGAVAPLQLLALSAGMRAITPLLSQVLTVLGETRLVMQYGLLCAVLLPAAFYLLGTRWGTAGLAVVWVVIFPILVLPAYQRVLRAIDLPVRDYLRALWPAASASLLMGLVILTIRWAGGADLSRPVRVAVEIAGGAMVYGLTCVALHGTRIAAFYRSLRPTGIPQPVREGLV